MRKRTSPLFLLFLAGCPKPEAPELEVFRFEGPVKLSPPKRTAPVELLTPAGERLVPREVQVKSEGLSIVLEKPSPPGSRLSVLLPRTARIQSLSARVNGQWREATREPTERADFSVPPVVQVEPRYAPVLPPGTDEVSIAYSASSTIAWFRMPIGDLKRIDSLAVMIDASASSAKDWDRRIDLLRALIEALARGSGGSIPVHIGVFDQTTQRLYEGGIESITPEHWQRLHLWRALGASNYGQMLASVASGLSSGMYSRKYARMVVLGDGLVTAGPRDPSALRDGAKRVSSQLGVKRIDVISMGELRSEELLYSMAEGGSALGALIDGGMPVPEIGRFLAAHVPVPLVHAVTTSTLTPSFYARRKARLGAPLVSSKSKLDPVAAPKLEVSQLDSAYSAIDAAPFDPIPIIHAGEIHAENNQAQNAARVFGSLIDLYPAEPEMLQLAAMRLEVLREETALRLAIDAFDKAAVMSSDRAVSHRLLAYSLLKAHQEALAFAVLERALKMLPPGPAQRILREDFALVAAAWLRSDFGRRDEIGSRLAALGVTFSKRPEVIFALSWNGDVDVDLVVYDAKNNALPLAGADDGMEIVAVRGEPRARSYPYRAEAHVHGRAALGVTAGKLEILEHDGSGGVWFSGRTFLLREEKGIVDLGTVSKAFGKGRGGS